MKASSLCALALGFGALLAAFACAGKNEPIDGMRVGDLVIGHPPPLLARDRVLLREWRLDEAGERYELIRVRIGMVPVDAEVIDGEIWRISIESAGLRTRDGVQVGDSLETLTRKNRSLRPELGPGPSLILIPDQPCGISYVTDALLSEKDLQNLSRRHAIPSTKNVHVSMIFVTGCQE